MTNLEIQAANAQINMSRDVSNILDNLEANHPTSIDWEQRRYEIAKDVFCHHMLDSQVPTTEANGGWQLAAKVQIAVELADRLIEELKKKK